MTTPNPVDIIAKLHYINQNNQDAFFNLLAFGLQATSLVIKSGSSVKNHWSLGFSNLSQSLNSSRFILRFLSGVSSIHILIQHRTFIVDFLKSLFTSKKKINQDAKTDKTESSETDENGEPQKEHLVGIKKTIQILRLVQALFTLANNVTEMPAYVSTVAPMLYNYRGDWFGRLSCFFWLLNTLVEVIIITLLKYSREIATSQYRIALVPLICDVFLSANWSLPSRNQFLSESGLTMLGLISAMVNFKSIWSNIETADQQ